MKKRTGNRSQARGRGNGFFDAFTKSKTTYRPGATKSALSAAYKAGVKFGDTGEFENWWSGYRNKLGVDKQKAKREFERGVEGEPSTEKVVAKKAVGIRGKYRGCNIYFDPDSKEYFGSCDRDSKFDAYVDVKKHIDWLKKGRDENPLLVGPVAQLASSHLLEYGVRGMKNPAKPWATSDDWEFWRNGDEVYRVGKGNAGYIQLDTKMPANVRWEASISHMEHYGPKLYPGFKIKGKRKNPDGRSPKEITEGFHGRESTDETEVLEEEHYQDELAGLGLLVELEVCDTEDSDKVVPIKFNYTKPEETVILACDRDGNIEFVGGDQDLEIEKLGIEVNGHQKVKLGYVSTISYFADKHHLEGPKSQAKGTEYIHEFGEEDGEMPCLIYDVRNKKMELVGGSYTITDEGIRN